jgi:hypothetical protein
MNLSQIYECRSLETELYNSVLEITVSFLGIQKWEPKIYTGFSFICSVTSSAKVATVLGSIPGSSNTVEYKGPQMKQCMLTTVKKTFIQACDGCANQGL